MRPTNQFLSIPEAARLLGLGPAAVRRAVARGDLPACQVRGCHAKIAAGVISQILEAAGSAAPLRRPNNSDETFVRLASPVPAA